MNFSVTTTTGIIVEQGSVISIVPEKIKAFMKLTGFLPEDVEAYCDWHGENYYPVELIISSDAYKEGTLALTDNYGGCRNFTLNSGKTTITNLLCGADYSLTLLDTGETLDFSTESDYPRLLRLESTDNTRDMGGKISADGRLRMKQGMVYRGANLRNVSEEDIRTLVSDLGLVTELDLSGGSESADVLADIIDREFWSVRWYGWIFEREPDYTERLVSCLRLFEKPEFYPVYMHCSLGRDRTGTVAFILQALCGISKEDIYREHLLTFFSLRGDGENAGIPAHLANINGLYEGFMGVKGPEFGIKENVEEFLRQIGLTDEEFDKIRDNLTEKL